VQIQKDQVIPDKIHIRYVPPFCTFMASTAIAKLEVYVMSLHRLPTCMGSFVVPVFCEACSLSEHLLATPNACLSPHLPTATISSKYVGVLSHTYHNILY
jgi:hypothetical protein